MSFRLKILLGGLIIVGGFLVVRIGMVFKGDMPTANIFNAGQNIFNSKSEDQAKIDSDRDGIPDFDEAYYQTDPFNPDTDGDGFKDGEEIASGCSPIKSRPGDCDKNINSGKSKKNITSELSRLITAGLYSGDLNFPSTNENFGKSLQLVKNQVLADFEENYSSRISATDLHLNEDNSLAANTVYIDSLNKALANSLLQPKIEVEDLLSNDYFLKLASWFRQSQYDLLAIVVPSDIKELHLELAKSLEHLATSYELFANHSTDPVAGVLSIEKLIDEYDKVRLVAQKINSYIENPPSAFINKTYAQIGGDAVPVEIVEDIPFENYLRESKRVRDLARDSLVKVQNEILNIINRSGRAGGPAFVLDWRQFLQKAQYRGENIFRAVIADATYGSSPTICKYLRKSLVDQFNPDGAVPGFDPSKYRVDSLQYFKLENRCTLPAGFDVDAFRDDFRNGGWEAWARLIEPQNNPFGLLVNSMSELYKQRNFEEQADQNEAQAGSGFLSLRSACKGTAPNRTCVVLGEIKTPGKVLEATVQRSIDEELSWLTSSDAVGELSAGVSQELYDSLMKKLQNLGAGKTTGDTENFQGGGGEFGGGGASGEFGNELLP